MTALIGIAASAIATAETRSLWPTMAAANKAAFDPVKTSLMGVFLGGTLMLGILGILVMSAEYTTGTVRATFAAAPRRPMVLAAKVLVFGTVSLVFAEVVAFAGFLLGQALLTSPAPHARCQARAPSEPSPAPVFSCAWSGSWPSASQS
jgi:hypothetical protein